MTDKLEISKNHQTDQLKVTQAMFFERLRHTPLEAKQFYFWILCLHTLIGIYSFHCCKNCSYSIIKNYLVIVKHVENT